MKTRQDTMKNKENQTDQVLVIASIKSGRVRSIPPELALFIPKKETCDGPTWSQITATGWEGWQ